MSSPYFLLALAAVITWLAQRLYRSIFLHTPSLPPGPKPLPLLGNLFDMPVSREYETYTQWGREYGDVVHVSALGQHIIILNSSEAANDLLDQRSAIYSDRPYIPMFHEPGLMDQGWNFVMKRYSVVWRRHRRLFSQHLNATSARAFFDKQTTAIHILLRSLLSSPTEFEMHLKHASAGIILGIVYGYDVEPVNDRFVALAEQMVETVTKAVNPGAYMVNVFPSLKYIPSWFPGVGFKKFAAEGRRLAQDLLQLPFEAVERRMAEGTAPPSFVAKALVNMVDESSQEMITDIQEVAASMYSAASDTTASTIMFCVLALVLNPSVQTRAQAELDSILGPPTSDTFRLPTFFDRPNLPYIEAILKESLRWVTAVPTGVPHATTEEDVYRGWRIPKGSIVIANAWSMLHDPGTYPEPFMFRPERFLPRDGKPTEPEPGLTGAFGFGRRNCPGRYLAEATLWLEIASMLSVFNFSLAKDTEGREIDISYASLPPPSMILHPYRFPCVITPRSKETEARVRETDQDGPLF